MNTSNEQVLLSLAAEDNLDDDDDDDDDDDADGNNAFPLDDDPFAPSPEIFLIQKKKKFKI